MNSTDLLLLFIAAFLLNPVLAEHRQLFVATEMEDGRRRMAAAAAGPIEKKVSDMTLLEQYKFLSNKENSVEKVAEVFGLDAQTLIDEIIYPISWQEKQMELSQELNEEYQKVHKDGKIFPSKEEFQEHFISQTVLKGPVPDMTVVKDILSHYGALDNEEIKMSDIRDLYEYCDDETSAIAQLYPVMDKVIKTLREEIQEELKTMPLYQKGAELTRTWHTDETQVRTVQSLYHGVRLFRAIMDGMGSDPNLSGTPCDVKDVLSLMKEDPAYAVILEHERRMGRAFSLEDFLRHSYGLVLDITTKALDVSEFHLNNYDAFTWESQFEIALPQQAETIHPPFAGQIEMRGGELSSQDISVDAPLLRAMQHIRRSTGRIVIHPAIGTLMSVNVFLTRICAMDELINVHLVRILSDDGSPFIKPEKTWVFPAKCPFMSIDRWDLYVWINNPKACPEEVVIPNSIFAYGTKGSVGFGFTHCDSRQLRFLVSEEVKQEIDTRTDIVKLTLGAGKIEFSS